MWFGYVASIDGHNKREYVYKENRYPGIDFLKIPPKDLKTDCGDIPEVIFCFWTGTNPLTPNRVRSINSIEKNSKLPVQLVTPSNLHDFILPDQPLHPAYEYLSCVHKADYLRCYFMNYIGGGYSDIKECRSSWRNAYESLNVDKTKIAVGYPENSPSDCVIAYCKEYFSLKNRFRLNYDMSVYYDKMIGNGVYIFRPKTMLSNMWIRELHRRLDINMDLLIKNPGNIWGDNYGYPLKWNSILGQIFHPLSLIFSNKIIRSNDVRPIMENYR